MVFIGITILLASLCATFILLSLFAPHRAPVAAIDTTPTAPAVQGVSTPSIPSPPATIAIEKINVSAPVHPVGLTSAGDMDINDEAEQTAWYKFGPLPGEVGSAVIAGHYGWKDGVPSVFNDLNTLVKGDMVTVYDEKGLAKKFIVTRTALYKPNQDATEVFISNDGKAHLNLITCQGSWNNSAQTYSERLIIFTDFVE